LRHIFQGLLTLFMGILMVLPAVAPAQADSSKVNPVPLIRKQALMIKVNNSVEVGQPVEGASVYSLKVANNKDIKQMPPTANNVKAQIVRAWNDADSVREKGVLVGNTDSAGQVSYSFPSPGQYMLAAFKDGFITGIARTNVLRAAGVTTVPLLQSTTTTAIEE